MHIFIIDMETPLMRHMPSLAREARNQTTRSRPYTFNMGFFLQILALLVTSQFPNRCVCADIDASPTIVTLCVEE